MIDEYPYLIDEYALELQKGRFSFHELGMLANGPRRGVHEPIDYSSILNRNYVESAFKNALLYCKEGVHYCHDHIFHLDSKTIRFKVFYDKNVNPQDSSDRVDQVLERVFTPVGFKVAEELDIIKANLILYSQFV